MYPHRDNMAPLHHDLKYYKNKKKENHRFCIKEEPLRIQDIAGFVSFF